MGFEDLDEKVAQDTRSLEAVREKVEWEARRIATAFGVKEWGTTRECDAIIRSGTASAGAPILLTTDMGFRQFLLEVGEEGEDCDLVRIEGRQTHGDFFQGVRPPSHCYEELMAHALYCLDLRIYDIDFSNFAPLKNLVGLLTEHQKLELRLSMPREFWPQRWLDEEAGQSVTV